MHYAHDQHAVRVRGIVGQMVLDLPNAPFPVLALFLLCCQLDKDLFLMARLQDKQSRSLKDRIIRAIR